jgi:hypothetical protein
VVGGALDGVHITSHGSGYTNEDGLKVVISSGGVGCEGLLLRAALALWVDCGKTCGYKAPQTTESKRTK